MMKFRRIVSLLLVLIMISGMLPGTLATETSTDPTEETIVYETTTDPPSESTNSTESDTEPSSSEAATIAEETVPSTDAATNPSLSTEPTGEETIPVGTVPEETVLETTSPNTTDPTEETIPVTYDYVTCEIDTSTTAELTIETTGNYVAKSGISSFTIVKDDVIFLKGSLATEEQYSRLIAAMEKEASDQEDNIDIAILEQPDTDSENWLLFSRTEGESTSWYYLLLTKDEKICIYLSSDVSAETLKEWMGRIDYEFSVKEADDATEPDETEPESSTKETTSDAETEASSAETTEIVPADTTAATTTPDEATEPTVVTSPDETTSSLPEETVSTIPDETLPESTGEIIPEETFEDEELLLPLQAGDVLVKADYNPMLRAVGNSITVSSEPSWSTVEIWYKRYDQQPDHDYPAPWAYPMGTYYVTNYSWFVLSSGEIGYCIQPYYPGTTGSFVPLDWGDFSEARQEGVALALIYGAPNNGDTTQAAYVATAAIVRDMAMGYRDAHGNINVYRDAKSGSMIATSPFGYNLQHYYPDAYTLYNQYLANIQKHGTVPSFASTDSSNAPTITLVKQSNGSYTWSDTDDNGVLEAFDFSCNVPGITFTKSGNKLTITATAAAVQKLTSSNNLVSSSTAYDYSNPAAGVTVWQKDSEHQKIVVLNHATDPAPAFFNLVAEGDTTTLRVYKVTTDGSKAGGYAFKVYNRATDGTVLLNKTMRSYGNGTSQTYFYETASFTDIPSDKTTTEWYGIADGYFSFRERFDASSAVIGDNFALREVKIFIYDNLGNKVKEYTINGSKITNDTSGGHNDYVVTLYPVSGIPAGGTVEVYAYNGPPGYKINITKKTSDSQNLAGWIFEVYDDAACTNCVAGPYITGTDGKASTAELPAGTYYVKETGHTDANVWAAYTCATANPQTVTLTNAAKPVTFTNNLKTYPITITKVTSDGNYKSGWQFYVYSDAACTKAVGGPYTTGSNGTVTTGSFKPGTYYVKETGHTNSTVWALYTCEKNPQTVTISSGTATVTFRNNVKHRFTITKDTSDGNYKAGWIFNIYKDENCEIKVGGPYTTGSDGTVTTTDYFEDGLYYVKETGHTDAAVWALYACATANPVAVNMSGADAKVSFTNNLTKGKITVKKAAAGDTSLTWRVGVYSNSACTSLVTTLTLKGDGTPVTTDWLNPGTYYLKEIDSRTGWICDTSTKTVTVTAGNTANAGTFTNTQQGKLTVQKSVVGDSSLSWDVGVYSNSACTTLVTTLSVKGDGSVTTSGWLNPGTYYLKETTSRTGWRCDTSVKTVTVSSGTTAAAVTFSNVQQGQFSVKKTIDTTATSTEFNFGIFSDAGCTTQVSSMKVKGDGVAVTSPYLDPGTYYVAELDNEGWTKDTTIQSVTVTSGGLTPISYTWHNMQLGRFSVIKTANITSAVTWSFGIYSDAACTNMVTSMDVVANGVAHNSPWLNPGTYYVREDTTRDGWTCDTTVTEVTVTAGTTTALSHQYENTAAGGLYIRKITNTGTTLIGGWQVGIYTDASCTSPIAGSPFTISSNGYIQLYLQEGTYYLKELPPTNASFNEDYWFMDDSVKLITIVAGETAYCPLENNQAGQLSIYKATSTGDNKEGWSFNLTMQPMLRALPTSSSSPASLFIVNGYPVSYYCNSSYISYLQQTGAYYAMAIYGLSSDPSSWNLFPIVLSKSNTALGGITARYYRSASNGYTTTSSRSGISIDGTSWYYLNGPTFSYEEYLQKSTSALNKFYLLNTIAGVERFSSKAEAIRYFVSLIDQTVTTDSSGVISTKLMLGNYSISEVPSADNYWISDTETKTVSVGYTKSSAVVFKNAQTSKLTIIKATTTGENRDGWQFDVVRKPDINAEGTTLYQSGSTSFVKAYDGDAYFAMYVYNDGVDQTSMDYLAPLLVSKNPDAVCYYGGDNDSDLDCLSFTYNGETWYCSHAASALKYTDANCKSLADGAYTFLNRITGVEAYSSPSDAAVDLLKMFIQTGVSDIYGGYASIPSYNWSEELGYYTDTTLIPGEYTITERSNGDSHWLLDGPKDVTIVGGDNTVIFENAFRSRISLQKVTTTGENLAGWQFDVIRDPDVTTTGELLYSVNGRNYVKTNDGDAYWMLVARENTSTGQQWFGPLLVSKDPDAVSYSTTGNHTTTVPMAGSILYNNETWYYSASGADYPYNSSVYYDFISYNNPLPLLNSFTGIDLYKNTGDAAEDLVALCAGRHTTDENGCLDIYLIPGNYTLTEVPCEDKCWTSDPNSYYLPLSDDVVEVQMNIVNAHVGELEIVKATTTGSTLSGWKFNVIRNADVTKRGEPLYGVGNQVYYKSSNGDAYFMIAARMTDTGAYFGPVLVGKTPESVIYTINGAYADSLTYTGTTVYNGETWYYNAFNAELPYSPDLFSSALPHLYSKFSSLPFLNAYTGVELYQYDGGWEHVIQDLLSVSLGQYTTDANGKINAMLRPGTYTVTEVAKSGSYWYSDTIPKTVTITEGETKTVVFENAHRGQLAIIKTTNTGANLGGWNFSIVRDPDVTKAGTLLYSANGRNYIKTYDGEAYFMLAARTVGDTQIYGPLLVSKDPEAVTYNTTGDHTATVTNEGSITFNGETWYYSGGGAHFHYDNSEYFDFAASGDPIPLLNSFTGVDVYLSIEEAAMDLLNLCIMNRTTPSTGVISEYLRPGIYTVTEIPSSNPYWISDTTPKKVTVTAGTVSYADFENAHYGELRIVKTTNTGLSLGNWTFNVVRKPDVTTASTQLLYFTNGAYTKKNAGDAYFINVILQHPGAGAMLSPMLVSKNEGAVAINYGGVSSASYVFAGSIEHNGETWYYNAVTARSITSYHYYNTVAQYGPIITINAVTGVDVYTDAADAAKDLLDQYIFSVTTDANGKVSKYVLPGSYTISEVKDRGDKWTYAADKNITIAGGIPVTATFYNEAPTEGQIHIQKIVNAEGALAEQLAGWQFKITDANGNEVEGSPFVTDENGEITTGLLYYGEYTVEEIIPTDSPFQVASENPVTVIVEGGGITDVEVKNVLRSGKITLEKLNVADEPLEGVTFLIEWWDEEKGIWQTLGFDDPEYPVTGACNNMNIANGCITTDATGIIVLENLYPTLKYRITEVATLDNYQLLAEPVFEGTLPSDTLTAYFKIVNATVYNLPGTGSDEMNRVVGIGTMVAMVCFTLAMLVAYLPPFIRRRKAHE